MNLKKIAYLVVGIIAGSFLANDVINYYTDAPVVKVAAAPTILGHRIGPGGIEMLVVKR